jgi:hypothetical protein
LTRLREYPNNHYYPRLSLERFKRIIDNPIDPRVKDIKREEFTPEQCATAAATMYPRLPIELFKPIIDNLSDDRATLCVTSLVCKAFLHASRCHLFYHVTIASKKEAKHFLDSINSSTSPYAYARELSVFEDHDDRRSHLNETLPLIAPRVSNITMLDLDSLVWDKLDDAARTTVLSSFPQVKDLRLKHCKFKTSEEMNDFIASFPSLMQIDCWGTCWQSYTEPVTPLPRSLTSVTLSSTQLKFFDRLLNFESHPNVHTICLRSIRPEDIPGVGRLLKTLGPRLEHLELTSALGMNAKG